MSQLYLDHREVAKMRRLTEDLEAMQLAAVCRHVLLYSMLLSRRNALYAQDALFQADVVAVS